MEHQNKLNLTLFGEDGAGGSMSQAGASGTAPGAEPGSTASRPGTSSGTAPDASGRAVGNGRERHTASSNKGRQTGRDSFEALIKGEYKREFDERVQSIINKRFRDAKETEERMRKAEPVLMAAAKRYGLDPSDLDGLAAAVQGDAVKQPAEHDAGAPAQRMQPARRASWGAAVPPQAARNKAARQRGKVMGRFDEDEQRHGAQVPSGAWQTEAKRVRTYYPSFDLQRESQNLQFVRLVENGVDMRTAYEALHQDDILGGAMQYTAQRISQQIANNIRARGMRPQENGMSARSAAVVKPDVRALSRSEREAISRRVLKGEKVSF